MLESEISSMVHGMNPKSCPLILHALLEPKGLGVSLMMVGVSMGMGTRVSESISVPLGVNIVQVDNDLPFPVSIHGSPGSGVEDVGGTDVASFLVVLLAVAVASAKIQSIKQFNSIKAFRS